MRIKKWFSAVQKHDAWLLFAVVWLLFVLAAGITGLIAAVDFLFPSAIPLEKDI